MQGKNASNIFGRYHTITTTVERCLVLPQEFVSFLCPSSFLSCWGISGASCWKQKKKMLKYNHELKVYNWKGIFESMTLSVTSVLRVVLTIYKIKYILVFLLNHFSQAISICLNLILVFLVFIELHLAPLINL